MQERQFAPKYVFIDVPIPDTTIKKIFVDIFSQVHQKLTACLHQKKYWILAKALTT